MDRRRLAPGVEALEGRQLQTIGMGRPPLPTLAAPAAGAASAPTIAPPLLPGPGEPLRHEVARTRFHATFSGPFAVGPPRYTGQSAVISSRGRGTSTQYLHGDYQMAIVLPKDPAAAITGAAYLQDKNTAGGNQLGLDLAFDAASADRRGRPTRGTWTADPNIYSGPNYFAQGGGTVRVGYSKGNASVVFEGSLYTNGITDPLANSALHD
jgi:hypothetical protein